MAKTTVPGLYIADGAITAAKLSSTLDLSGVTITVATASTGDNDTTVASTAFVQQEIAALVDSSPSALNTLNELAAAIGDDASFSTTVTNSIATKLALAGGTMTGDLIINTTGSLQIPVGTTAQRPTAAQGQLRFNTTTSKPEIYNGSAWADVGGGVESVNSATGVVVLTTANIAENTNLYYTDARADARIAAADTDDLSEGSTNLYFTTARANSAIDGRLSGSTGVTVSNGAISIGQDVATSTSPTFQNLTLSGTDSVKVPSGTTAQRSGSPANGMLRYNSSTNEFEGYANSAWGAIGGDTTSSVDLYTATGNGSTATYDTGKNPQSENNTWVFIGGVYQPKSTYSFSGTEITLSENLPNGEDLEVITGTVSTYNPTDAILGQYNVTTSNTASYDTSLTTENENNVFVFIDGVYQPKSSYTYSGSTLTLDAVPTSGMSLEVLVTRSMNAATVTTGFLADDAVTTAKITDANVTAAKLASSLDLTGKTVTVATASAGDNDTSVASTAFVRQEITSLVDSAPAAMDTLNELAAALGDDANFSTTVNASIAAKAPLAGPTFTGDVTFDTSTLVVDATNNRVGIGTTSPLSKLDVAGNVRISDGVLEFDKPSVYGFRFLQNDAGNDLSIQQGDVNNANYVTRLNIGSTGNVGINTSSPTSYANSQATLVIQDSTSPAIAWSDTGQARDWFAVAQGSGLYFNYADGGGSGGASNVTDVLVLDNSGNVGIGISPSNTFSVGASGTVTTRYTSTDTSAFSLLQFENSGSIVLSADHGNSAANSNIIFKSDGAIERMRIDSSGRVIVSSAGSPFGADSVTIDQGGFLAIRNTSGSGMEVRRDSTDGSLIDFQKDGSAVGSIGTKSGGLFIGSDDAGIFFNHHGSGDLDAVIPYDIGQSSFYDGHVNLGASGGRFKDLYLSGMASVGHVVPNTAGTYTVNHLGVYSGGITINAASSQTGWLMAAGNGKLSWASGGAMAGADGLGFHSTMVNRVVTDQTTATKMQFYLNDVVAGEWKRTGSGGSIRPNQYSSGDTAANLPGLASYDDENTGVYWPAADNLGISVGGSQAVLIDSDKYMSVGNESAVPNNLAGLHVKKGGLLINGASASSSGIKDVSHLSNYWTFFGSSGQSGTFSGNVRISVPAPTGTSGHAWGGFQLEVYISGYSGKYCSAMLSGYTNNSITLSEATIIRSSGSHSVSYGTITHQGFYFDIDIPSYIHPSVYYRITKAGDPSSDHETDFKDLTVTIS